MKKMLLKTILTFVSGLIVMVIIAGCNGSCIDSCMSSCGIIPPIDPLSVQDDGIYQYVIWQRKVHIVGLTESGQSKTELVIPEYIDGRRVVTIGYNIRMEGMPVWVTAVEGDFSSENLLKLYIPLSINDFYDMGCSNCPNAKAVVWRDEGAENYYLCDYLNNQIVGYNILSKYLSWRKNDSAREGNLLANVSYMYNYESAQDDGYYWVDSYDSSIISFIPPEPHRAGYTFGGWYKEPECINAWNFETDKTGEEIPLRASDFEDYDANQITYLYAKWIKS